MLLSEQGLGVQVALCVEWAVLLISAVGGGAVCVGLVADGGGG